MRAKKTKPITKKKYVRRKPKAVATAVANAAVAVDEALPSVVALLPDRQRRHAVYNSLVLLAAVMTLTVLASTVAFPTLFSPIERVEKRLEVAAIDSVEIQLDEAAIDREIERALKEGGYASEIMPPIVLAPPVAKAEIEATAKKQAKPRTKAQRRLERRQARARAAGMDALASASTGNDLIAEARKYLGGNPTGRASEWCGAFLDMVLKRTGRRGGGNLARGYINYGTRIARPEVGAIVVLSRTGGGHVGIVTGVDANGNPIVISGNHNRRVAESTYPASRVIAYVRPNG